MKESRDKTTGELRTELRQLRKTVHELADAIDEIGNGQDIEHGQNGPPEHAQNAMNKAQKARDIVGDPVPEDEKIVPPGQR